MSKVEVTEDTIGQIAGLLDQLLKAGPNSQDAISTISNLESFVGFRTCLLNIISRQNLNDSLRFAATTYLKNSIKHYFAKNMTQGLDKGAAPAEILHARGQEQVVIKQMLLSQVFAEGNEKIADFLSETIAEIAEVQSIQKWEALLPTIFNALGSACTAASSANTSALPAAEVLQALSRATVLIEAVFASLGKRRYFRQGNEEVIKSYFMPVFEAWKLLISFLLTALSKLSASSSGPEYALCIAISKACKTSTETICHSVSLSPHFICDSVLGQTAFPKIAETLDSLSKSQASIPATRETRQLRTLVSDIRGFAASAVLTAQELSPLSFKPYLAPFLSIFSQIIATRASIRSQRLHELATQASQGRDNLISYVMNVESNEEGEGSNKGRDSCAVQAVNFVTRVLNCKQYEEQAGSSVKTIMFSSSGGIQFNNADTATEIASMLQNFFNDSYIENMIKMLVMGILPWTALDISRWLEEPEVFYQDQSVARCDIEERSAASALLLALAHRRPSFVSPLIQSMLRSALEAENAPGMLSLGLTPHGEPSIPSQVLVDILTRDAVFLAVGTVLFDLRSLGYNFDLKQLVDFISAKTSALLDAVHSTTNPGAGAVLTINKAPFATFSLYRCVWLASNLNDMLPSSAVEQFIGLCVRLFVCSDTVLRLQATYGLKVFVDSSHFETLVPQFVAPQPGGGASFLSTCIHKLLQLCSETSDYESRALSLLVIREIVQRVGKEVSVVVPVLLDALPRFWMETSDENNLRLGIVDTLTAIVVSLEGRSQALHGLLGEVLSFSTNPNDQQAAYLFERGMLLWDATIKNAVDMTPALLNQFGRWVEIYSICEDSLEEGLSILESYMILGRETFLNAYSAPLAKILPRFLNELGENGLCLCASVVERTAQLFPSMFIETFPNVVSILVENCRELLLHGPLGDRSLAPSVYASFFAAFAHLFVHDTTKTANQLSAIPAGSNTSMSALNMLFDCWLLNVDSIKLLFQKKLSAMALYNIITVAHRLIRLDPERIVKILVFSYEIMSLEAENGPYSPIDLSEYAPEMRTETYRLIAIANVDPAERISMREFSLRKLHELATISSNDFVTQCLNLLPASMKSSFN